MPIRSNFNPRTSFEVRPQMKFVPVKPHRISIHAPLSRCDTGRKPVPSLSSAFQSTHLFRGATNTSGTVFFNLKFQSTHLFRGATFSCCHFLAPFLFQSTHLFRGATMILSFLTRSWSFQSTHLFRGATGTPKK